MRFQLKRKKIQFN